MSLLFLGWDPFTVMTVGVLFYWENLKNILVATLLNCKIPLATSKFLYKFEL
jgi:hypothetical protein